MSFDETFSTLLGPNPGASVVKRVLETAFDPGHADPRHRDHWWSWEDWPLDGRQWEPEFGKYKLKKGAVSEHKARKKMEGAFDSRLKVERKLEGIIWDYDKPHSALRSTGAFAVDMIIVEPDESDEDESDEDENESDEDDSQSDPEKDDP
jgi:hypothetical protein